jgi:transcriptional regulator with XRE-family HTH domain
MCRAPRCVHTGAQRERLMSQKTTFSDALRSYRLAVPLTQEELAAKLNVASKTVASWEQGTRQRPRLNQEKLDLLVDTLRLEGAARTAFVALAKGLPQGKRSSWSWLTGGTMRRARRVAVPVGAAVLLMVLVRGLWAVLATSTTLVREDYDDARVISSFGLSFDSKQSKVTDAVNGGERVVGSPSTGGLAALHLEKAYERTDIAVAVDVWLKDASPDQSVGIGCRFSGPNADYGFGVFPATGEFLLARAEGKGKGQTSLRSRGPHNSIRLGDRVNHLELSCVSNLLVGRINGEEVVRFEDQERRYESGGVWIALGAWDSAYPRAEAHLDRVVVRRCDGWDARLLNSAPWISRITGGIDRPRCSYPVVGQRQAPAPV